MVYFTECFKLLNERIAGQEGIKMGYDFLES